MFSLNIFSVFILLAAVQIISCAVKLPPGVDPCKQNDPNFNQCALKVIPHMIPQIVAGEPKYHIPVLDPLFVPHIDVDNGQLHLIFKDVNFHGIRDVQVPEFNLDIAKGTGKVVLFFPKLTYDGEYNVKGQILVLPISGQGPANITIIEGKFPINFKFSFKDKGGKKHAVIGEHSGSHEIKRAYIQLDGLFGGNKELSEQMNNALNQNWKEVLVEVGPAINDALREVLKQIVNKILDKVPFAQMFPEK